MVIEHNDFLLEASSEDEIRSAMISQWLNQVRRVSELSVPGTSRGEWLSDAIDPGKYGMQRFDMTMKSHAMDLGEVKRSGGDPVSLLDAKTRAKIRRAMREYSALGELCVETSSSVVQGLEWLDSLEMLHQKRWVAKGEPGCFGNPRFVRFHRMMIARNHGNGSTIVMRVSVGDAALGYLYGFADKERFYLYQCGFDYDMVERNSMPGLVCHMLAMQTLADRGLKLYDFMAGSSGYKSALSNVEESMTWTIFRSHSVRLSLIERVNPVLAKVRCHKKQLIKALESIRTRTALLATPSNTAKQGI
jgi:CelD/BcsL family acetyltransferase involved in cellulose biosynthesis